MSFKFAPLSIEVMTQDERNQARQDRAEKMSILYTELGEEPPSFDAPMPPRDLTAVKAIFIGCGFVLSLLGVAAMIICVIFKLLF